MIFILFVTIAVAGSEPERYLQHMASMEACWKAAQDFSQGMPPDMIARGVSIGCFQKLAGEPS